MDKNAIVEMLRNHRLMIAKMRTLEIDINKLLFALVSADHSMTDMIYEALSKILFQYYEAHKEVAIIKAWLCLLYDDERFLVSKHLIGGLTWPHVIFEYEARWGKENGRSERTMKRTQAIAIDKIVTYMKTFSK